MTLDAKEIFRRDAAAIAPTAAVAIGLAVRGGGTVDQINLMTSIGPDERKAKFEIASRSPSCAASSWSPRAGCRLVVLVAAAGFGESRSADRAGGAGDRNAPERHSTGRAVSKPARAASAACDVDEELRKGQTGRCTCSIRSSRSRLHGWLISAGRQSDYARGRWHVAERAVRFRERARGIEPVRATGRDSRQRVEPASATSRN